MSKLDLAAIRAKLAQPAQPTVAGVDNSHTTTVATTSTPSTPSTVMQQVQQLVQTLPVDDPALSPEDNYLRQASASEVQNKIQELQERLVTAHPTMPVLLQEIHNLLKQQPDNVTLLSDEQINVIVSGLLRSTNTVLAAKTIAKRATKKVSQALSLSDLGF